MEFKKLVMPFIFAEIRRHGILDAERLIRADYDQSKKELARAIYEQAYSVQERTEFDAEQEKQKKIKVWLELEHLEEVIIEMIEKHGK